MAKNKLEKFGNITLEAPEKESINNFLLSVERDKKAEMIKVPHDFILCKVGEEQNEYFSYDGSQQIG
ncbi:MAG: hypothetical protein KDD45_10085 [Bdellovibrionales bacterium]|nr:hypothetical protein [Bdellovibrionales bacterium]